MHNSFDSLSLQQKLLRVASGIGGTWTPALAVVEDTALKSTETRELADGRTLVTRSRLQMNGYGSLQGTIYLVTMLRELSVVAPGVSAETYVGTRLTSSVSLECDPTDPDSVLAAIDKCCEQIDADSHALRIALEDAHV